MGGNSAELGRIACVQGLEFSERSALGTTRAHYKILRFRPGVAKTAGFAHVGVLARGLARRLLAYVLVFERDFVGFMPDDFLDLYLDAMLRRVAEHAPYDSNCTAIIAAQPRRGYLAKITVETSTGAFVGESVASEPKLALDLAEEHLFQRLADWRKTRWDDEAA